MIRFFVTVLLVAMLGGCQSSPAVPQKYSPEFTKSAKFTWSLLQQASEGQPVREADLSLAFANLESVTHTSDEISTKITLETYRLDLQLLNLEHRKKDHQEILAKMKRNICEIDEVLDKGTAAYQAAKDCGENLP